MTLDGGTGRVIAGQMPLREPAATPELLTMLRWADELRSLAVYANADTPADARKARSLGAQGIGLCRTEHMFFAPERLTVMQRMIAAETEAERRSALAELLPMQQEDFEGMFEAMDGLPVTIRLLDPPLTAAQIAEHADFFSFGTNDLTQMTFGCSRDDAEGKFLARYVERKLLRDNPFQVLDADGVGQLIRMAAENGRAARGELKTGICGEHGEDRESIFFCHQIGLDYVSCSPYRIPMARIAAAQAALEHGPLTGSRTAVTV